MNANARLFSATRRGDVEGVKSALRSGAEAASDDGLGVTPLHLAALYGHFAVVDMLLASGARINVNSLDLLGETPLHNAALRGHADVVSVLLNAGADPGIKNYAGETPLDLALQRGHPEVEALLKASDKKRNML